MLDVAATASNKPGRPRPSAEQIARTREIAGRLIEPLRTVARQHGYALAVHGSLERDIDLIAVPWAEPASAPADLVELLRVEAAFQLNVVAFFGSQMPQPQVKPHGRLAWSIYFGGLPTYLDVSVAAIAPSAGSGSSGQCDVGSDVPGGGAR